MSSMSWIAYIFLFFSSYAVWCADNPKDVQLKEQEKISLTCSPEEFAQLMKRRNSWRESTEQYLERRRILEANLPAYANDVQSIFYQFDQPGLKFYVEHGPYGGSHTRGVEAKNFRLIYDPGKFSKGSVIRRTFGEQPLDYTMADVRFFSQSHSLGNEGSVFEIYVKGPLGAAWRNEDGGLIMISRDTGQLRFYPPGSDVDGEAAGVLRGSLSAIWSFAKGLAGEAQCAICKYAGEWLTDRQVLQVNDRNSPPVHAIKQLDKPTSK